MTIAAVQARPKARWILPPEPDAAVVERLEQELHLPRAICRLLAPLADMGEPDDAKTFLRPRLDQLHGAHMRLADLDRAVERLQRALRENETILVHGDYDVDGICSTTLMVRTLIAAGGNAIPFIPSRLLDGYDLTDAGVRAAHAAGATLVVTCDCGTSAIAPNRGATGEPRRIDVIVTDHHLPGGPLPAGVRRPQSQAPGLSVAGQGPGGGRRRVQAGARADARRVGGNENVVLRHARPRGPRDHRRCRAAPRGKSRARPLWPQAAQRHHAARIARDDSRGRPRAKALTAGRIGFILAPRLNAAGRLGSALRGVELLMTANEQEANPIARELEELNATRQEIDRATLDARARSSCCAWTSPSTFGIVLAEQGWHAGVIGIVASRIVEEFGRPTVLVALDGAEGKGSGRSISAFNLHDGLSKCSDLLLRFGGHRAAAGVTISASQVAAFAKRCNDVAMSQLTEDDLVPELRVDLELQLDHANEELEALLRHMEPCGIGNPSPLFVARRVTVAAPPRVVGKDGLKLVLNSNGRELTALGWGMGAARRRASPSARYDRRRVSPRARRVSRPGTLAGAARRFPRVTNHNRENRRRASGAAVRSTPPRTRTVRPTGDRVREAWISIVNPWLAGAKVVDLFSGSGALGIEALSRGARRSSTSLKTRPRSSTRFAPISMLLGAGPAAVVHREDALKFVKKLEPHAYDVAFADPPYDVGLAPALAEQWLAAPFADILGIEHRAERDTAW